MITQEQLPAEPPIESQSIAMKGIITNEHGEVLVLEEAHDYEDGANGGKLQLPGGRTELGEDLDKALCREIFEETGRKVTPGKPVGYGSWSPIIPGRPRVQIAGIFVECHLDDPTNTEIHVNATEHHRGLWIGRVAFDELNRAGRIIPPDNSIIDNYLRAS